jgi:hypothetical protein
MNRADMKRRFKFDYDAAARHWEKEVRFFFPRRTCAEYRLRTRQALKELREAREQIAWMLGENPLVR